MKYIPELFYSTDLPTDTIRNLSAMRFEYLNQSAFRNISMQDVYLTEIFSELI
jgi:hypothetical protein